MTSQTQLYPQYRQAMRDLHHIASQQAMRKDDLLFKTATKLGMLGGDGRTLILDDDYDMVMLAEALLYEMTHQGRKTIASILEGYRPRSDLERYLIAAMGEAALGLYRVEAADPQEGSARLKALVPECADDTLINLNFAETAAPGMVVALRLLHLPEMNVSSGMIFPFPATKEVRLHREWWSHRGLERYAHVRRLCRKIGIRFEPV